MNQHARRYTLGAAAAGIVAAAALAGPWTDAAADWTPVTRGLAESPAQLLPSDVSTAHPVGVVTTVLDDSGRPVVTANRATDRAAAEKLIRAGQQAPRAIAVELDAPVYTLGVPTGTDPYSGSQWDLATVRVAAAWPKSTGAGVTVAVIDSGVDAGHPDLAGQVLPGVDLVANTSGTSTDPNGHGTHVAGTIAALTGNGIGVAGFAPDAKILPIRTQNANGSGLMSTVATGIVYAADHGAQVVNMSLGSSGQTAAVTNAVAYARSKGVVVVASAGNSRASGSPTNYPAADPGVIGVASTDSADRVSSFSNQGGYVDIAAPGGTILSTIPAAKGSYAYMSGTSMASPHIAAVAALLKSYHPTLTPDQVEQAMTKSAVDLGATGRDNDYGYGRVDAAAALAAVLPATTTPTAPTVAPSSATPPATVKPTTTPTASPTTKPTATPTTKPTATPTTKPTATPTTKPTPTPVVKVTPIIRSDKASQTVTYGTATTTTFTVTAGGKAAAGLAAQICTAENNSSAFQCTGTVTSAAGTVIARKTATGTFRIKLMVPATATSTAAVSGTYTYTVRAAATLAKNGSTALLARVTGAAGQTVQVQRLDGQKWITVATYRAAATCTISGVRTGSTYRVVVPNTATITGATSNSLRV